MSEAEIVRRIRQGRPGPASLDGLLQDGGDHFWGPLRDAARAQPGAFDAAAVDWIAAHVDACPRAAFAALLDLAGRDADRAADLVARFRSLMETRPADALAAAGYNLFEYCRLLDARWIADARRHYAANPAGAWGIMTAAASYARAALWDDDIAWFEARAADAPGGHFRMAFALADRGEILARALALFPAHPAEGVEAAAGQRLYRPDVAAAVLRHFPSNPEKAWEYFGGAPPELLDLDALVAQAPTGARACFAILHRARAVDRFTRLLPAHPADGIDQAHYLAHNDPELLTPALVDAVVAHFAADPYHAYDVLRAALEKRPELLALRHVEAAVAPIPLATNWAFGFFRRLLEVRPEHAPLAVLALFECLAHEPVNRATTRIEEMESIVAIAQASQVRTELERALRRPPGAGSRRARALMAILFRQASRSRQHVLFEALRLAATACTWSDRGHTPLWDFFLLLLDQSSEDAVSTAAAERFLEGAFQLNYLMDRGADHDAFRSRFDVREPEPAPWPEPVAFLAADPALDRLYRTVACLAGRFGTAPRLAFAAEYEGRVRAAEEELARIGGRADLAKRREALLRRLAAWRDPSSPDAAGFLRKERHELAKRAADALRAELARIAVEAVEGARLGLYASKLESVLGRRVDVKRLEPSILPAFLFFGALGHFPNNRKGLARLIEDRLEGRPHDWLWTEPPVLEWKERVRAAFPSADFSAWRAPFSKDVSYRPQDASAEKKRRVRDDLAQAQRLLEQAGAKGLKDASAETLAAALAALRAPREDDAPAPDPRLLEEVEMNLERVRIVLQTPESDFEGRLRLEVEADPFQVLFMGEYGFASCLSLRGSNVWSAVSNAIDVDKAVLWAKEPGGNVVGRRLVALTDRGVVSYRTYANRHGLALDGIFEDFIAALARRVGVPKATGGASPGPLLSDRWYDDGAI